MCLGVALRGTCAVHTPDDMPRLRFQVGTVAHPESHACSVYPSGRMDRAGGRSREGCASGAGDRLSIRSWAYYTRGRVYVHLSEGTGFQSFDDQKVQVNGCSNVTGQRPETG